MDNSRDLLHLIDGGVADNSGVESLVQLFLRKLIANPKRRGMIIELNAGLPFNARGTAIADDSHPLTAIIDDPTRLSDIQEVRASLYRQDLWLLTENVAKTMKHSTNAVTRLDIKQLQHTDLRANSLRIDNATCHVHFDDARSVREAVRNIPTNYHLDPCSADLVRIAACWSVHQHAAELAGLLQRQRRHGQRERKSGRGPERPRQAHPLDVPRTRRVRRTVSDAALRRRSPGGGSMRR